MKSSGIYRIYSKCKPERVYIGSTNNLKKRKKDHFKTLKGNYHGNPLLQHHYNKYGGDDLVFVIVEFCFPYFLTAREQYYMDKEKPWFNICKVAGSPLGVKRSEETKRKIGLISKQRVHSEETRRKISKGNKGKNNSFYGRKHSEKTKQKIKKARAKQVFSEDAIKRRTEHLKGRKHTEEAKEKMKRTYEKKECPYCGTKMAKTQYKRFHGDNCKYKSKLQTT